MGGVTSQIASQCCCEKDAVYTVKKGTWTSPFETTAEYLAVSDVWRNKKSPSMSADEGAVVVLIGGTGVGKSNLGNYLLGRNAFESRTSQESVTLASSRTDGSWFGGIQPLRVVDCVGIGDTKGATADQKQWDTTIEVLKEIGQVNALVMVMRAGRFTKFDKETIRTLRESFGPYFWRNMCVFLTGASAKPAQLNLDVEGPKLRQRMEQVEREIGADPQALQAIQRMHVYAADLDPVLTTVESRTSEFKFKPSLVRLGLEELISLDLRIPPNVMDMRVEEFRRFATSDPTIERWIEGNYHQLGLCRLAAFKADVLAMPPFKPGQVNRLADAPEDEKPPPDAGTNEALLRCNTASLEESAGISPSYFTAMEFLEAALLGSDVKLVKGSFLQTLASQRGIAPRRQELPPQAFWDSREFVQELKRAGHQPPPVIVSISYCWLSHQHPDPEGFYLRWVSQLLSSFAKWNRIAEDRIAVFWDWLSLPQEPRSPEEKSSFDTTLQHMHLWYAHTATSVWCLSRVPEGASAIYTSRAWTFFERSIAGMGDPAAPVLDLGMLRSTWNSWAHVLQDCKVRPQPPLAPEAFVSEMVRKNVRQESDRQRLAQSYGTVFRAAVSAAPRLHYAALRWGDREAVRLAKLLSLCTSCQELELQQNDIGQRGARALLAALPQCPGLYRLALWGNCIDPESQELLRTAWQQAGKPAAGLELGDQRKSLTPTVEVDGMKASATSASNASPTMSRKNSFMGLSPAGARRSPEEMAALQMAELGARQAAFEARLHVAISRISSALSEVGDAVGGHSPKSMATSLTTPSHQMASPSNRTGYHMELG